MNHQPQKIRFGAFLGILIVLGLIIFLGVRSITSKPVSQESSTQSLPGSNTPVGPLVPVTADELATITARLQSSAIQVPDTTEIASLKDGNADFKVSTDTLTEGSIELGMPVVAVNVPPESKDSVGHRDVIAPFLVNTGGTGEFLYIMVLQDLGNVFAERSYAYFGDRIQITSIKTLPADKKGDDYKIVVSYLTHADGEGLASEPTHPKETTLVVTGGHLDPKQKDTKNL